MYNRILVINLMYIGDLLFATPLLRTLRANYPEAEIVLLADKKNCDVVRYNPHISELIAIDKKGYHNKLKNYLGVIADIRRRQFDLVINLHRNERASAIAAFSGAKKIIGFSAKGFGFFFDKVVHERTDIHQVDAYMETLKAVGVKRIDNQGLEMWVDEKSQKKADEIWQYHFPDTSGNLRSSPKTPVIGINTGGSWPTKRWTKSGFANLADKILASGYGVVFFGGPMDKEDVEEILSLMVERDSPQLVLLTGKTTLLEMAALANKCTAFISGDSGPMHIAVSQKVPVIAIFGPSDPLRYAPYGQKKSVIKSNQECLGCGEHSCVGHECMHGVTIDMVWSQLAFIIKHPT
ncbi:MAG: lipopolysaccharide heptosyltransferase II [Negativicutes bacterium]|jgi:heptosyltransferase-2